MGFQLETIEMIYYYFLQSPSTCLYLSFVFVARWDFVIFIFHILCGGDRQRWRATKLSTTKRGFFDICMRLVVCNMEYIGSLFMLMHAWMALTLIWIKAKRRESLPCLHFNIIRVYCGLEQHVNDIKSLKKETTCKALTSLFSSYIYNIICDVVSLES